jgi:hypothetical protein
MAFLDLLYRGSGQQISAPRAGASCTGTWGLTNKKHNRGSGVRGLSQIQIVYHIQCFAHQEI